MKKLLLCSNEAMSHFEMEPFPRKSLSITNWRRQSDIWDDRFPEEELNSVVFIKMLSIKVLVFFANFVGSTMYGAKICMYQLFMP